MLRKVLRLNTLNNFVWLCPERWSLGVLYMVLGRFRTGEILAWYVSLIKKMVGDTGSWLGSLYIKDTLPGESFVSFRI